jgi:hypothetical protein
MKLVDPVEEWERAETAARWHPEVGWFSAHLNIDAVLELKALGVGRWDAL